MLDKFPNNRRKYKFHLSTRKTKLYIFFDFIVISIMWQDIYKRIDMQITKKCSLNSLKILSIQEYQAFKILIFYFNYIVLYCIRLSRWKQCELILIDVLREIVRVSFNTREQLYELQYDLKFRYTFNIYWKTQWKVKLNQVILIKTLKLVFE